MYLKPSNINDALISASMYIAAAIYSNRAVTMIDDCTIREY